MNKHLPHFPFWHHNPDTPVQHQLALPLFILAALLILSGLLSLSFTPIAVGVIGVIAGLGLERQGSGDQR